MRFCAEILGFGRVKVKFTGFLTSTKRSCVEGPKPKSDRDVEFKSVFSYEPVIHTVNVWVVVMAEMGVREVRRRVSGAGFHTRH